VCHRLVGGGPVSAAVASGRRTSGEIIDARREKLFQDLVRLENDHRNGRGDCALAGRREELVAALERVHGALDTDDTARAVDRKGLPA
jgi:hypothetical protein